MRLHFFNSAVIANSKMDYSLSPLGAQNNGTGAASQTLLTGVRLRLRCRLEPQVDQARNMSIGEHRHCCATKNLSFP